MIIDLPTVDANPGPTPQLQGFQAPESKNVAAAQLSEQGAAVTKGGVVLRNLMQDFKDDVATAKVKDADNATVAFFTEKLHNPTTGFFSQQGKNALTAMPDVIRDLDDYTQKVSENLTDPLEQAMWKKVSTARLATAKASIYGHVHNESKVWLFGATDARMKTFMQTAISASGDISSPTYTDAMAGFHAEREALSSMMGLAPEQAELARKTDLTAMHTEAINNMIKSEQPLQAEEYFKEMKARGQILSSSEHAIQGALNTAVDTYKGKQAGKAAFGDFIRDTDINKPIPIEAAINMVERDSSLSDKAKEMGVAQVHALASREASVRKGQAEASSNIVYGIMAQYKTKAGYQKTLEAIDQQPISEHDKGMLRAHADTFYHISEDRALARQEQAMQKHITAAFNAGQFIEGYIRGDYGKLSGQDVLQTKGAELGAMTIPVAKVVDKIQTKLENPQLTMAEFNRKLITIYATPEGKDLLGFNPASKDADDVQKKILLLDATLGKMSVSGTKGPGKEVISLDQAILNSLSTMTVPNSFLGIPYTSKTKDYLISTMTPAQKEAFAIERRKKAGKTSWTKEDIQNDVRLLNKSYTKTGVKSAATDEDEE